jgi:hypothetical protein
MLEPTPDLGGIGETGHRGDRSWRGHALNALGCMIVAT